MKVFIVVIVVAVLAVGGYFIYKGSYKTPSQSSTSSNSTSISTNNVNISNFSFDPASVTVKAGSAITFANKDNVAHTVTENNGKFNQEIAAGQTATITITDPGTYSYHCSIHPSMTGTIIVQ